MNSPLRWQQRFENFGHALRIMQKRVGECQTHHRDFVFYEAFQMALVQSFEIVIELAWKTLKDYLENEGYEEVQNSKKTIRQASVEGLIENGEIWMAALEKRNITSHTYEAAILDEVCAFVLQQFIAEAEKLEKKLCSLLP